MSNQRKSLCRAFAGHGRGSGLATVMAAALLGLLLLPPGKAAWGQMPAENGSEIGVADFSRGHKGEAGSDRALRLLTLAPVPVNSANTTAGAMYSFDISFVDQETQTYYLADRSNKAVDVVDAKTGQFTKQI